MSNLVAITSIADYTPDALAKAIPELLESATISPRSGDRVLVKPNLVAGNNAVHCTTHPAVVKATCAFLLDSGARVTVADSPGYGPAAKVAASSGLEASVRELGLTVDTLKNPVAVPLTNGGTIGIAKAALDADMILNIPKLKVHCQMTMSGAVKNLFGCVVGFRKAFAHSRLGHSHSLFSRMLMDVYKALPQAVHLMDGIHPLHKDGPIKGEPFELGLLSASTNGVALDTAAYTVLGLTPQQVPLWNEAHVLGLSGSDLSEVSFPMAPPTGFDATGFVLSPERELSFAPSRLIAGRVRSLVKYFKK